MTTSSLTPQESILVPADQVTANRFLIFLFRELSSGFVEFRFLSPENKSKQAAAPVYLTLPLNVQLLETEILSRNGGQLITFGPAPRFRVPTRGRAGKDHDVLEVSCIWANIEHNRTRGGAIEVLRRIQHFPLRPSAVVNTGLGHQVYFVFHEPYRDVELLKWSELMLHLSLSLSAGSPPAISDVASLPGTSYREASYAVRCAISEECSSWMRYGTGEVEAALQSATDNLSGTQSFNGEKTDAFAFFTIEQLRRRGLSAEFVEAILTGRGLSQYMAGLPVGGDESGPDFRLAYALFEKGFAEREIKAVFQTHPNGCGRKWARKRDGEKYLNSLLVKASTRLNEVRGRTASRGILSVGGKESFTSSLPPDYVEREDGSIWFHPPISDESRKTPKPVKVCNSPIRITEIHEHIDTGQISVVISFDYLDKTISAAIPRSRMADGRQLVSSLSGVGAPITSINARHITAYLAAYEHSFASTLPRKRMTSRFGRGRADGPFFFPGTSHGIEFSPLGPGDASLFRAYASRRGSLQGWLEAMRAVTSEGLMIPQVAVLASFVPPLQRRLQIPNFIVDLHGNTSTGKSTSLRMAASVYGKPNDPDSLVLQWMNTSAAIEQIATVSSELPVFLDDAQHCPPELKKLVVYMIANGRGKGRGAAGGRGGISETPTWHTVALSTSEEPLHESSPHEGARGRILSIGGLTPPFRPGTAALIHKVERVIDNNHGHAGELYIRHLNNWTTTDVERWFKRQTEIRSDLLRSSSSDLVGRVSGYIAAIQLAAEVACPLLGLPFQGDVVGAWLMLHLGEQQREQNVVLVALRALADYYVANTKHFAGDGHYDKSRRSPIHGMSKKGQYVGFLATTVDAIFRPHKWNQTAVLNKLTAAGSLIMTETNRHTKKVSVEGVQHRMVCVKWSALLPEEITPVK